MLHPTLLSVQEDIVLDCICNKNVITQSTHEQQPRLKQVKHFLSLNDVTNGGWD